MILTMILALISYSAYLTLMKCIVIAYMLLLLISIQSTIKRLFIYDTEAYTIIPMGILTIAFLNCIFLYVTCQAYHYYCKSGGLMGNPAALDEYK